ncbi:MAG: hypothetical protein AAF557_06850 [Pseudomonadota bacterium]
MMLRGNGIRCVQYQADDSNTVLGTAIAANLSAGRPLMAGLQRYSAFLDMSIVTPEFVFEGCRLFWQMHAEYPNSYFILNTRPIENWIDSRALYLDGLYAERYADAFGYDEVKIQQVWRKQYLAHLSDVRAHFAEDSGKFLEFNIEEDDPVLIADFLYPDFNVDPADWGHWNATDFDALVAEEAELGHK